MADSTTPVTVRDLSSLSNPHEAKLTHLVWNLKVDFDRKVLEGEATYTFERIGSPKTLDLDTAHLIIHSVTDEDGNFLKYKLHPCKQPHLGQKLSISIEDQRLATVSLKYDTTSGCSAIQWLPPSATSGKVYPYLFTQCQAIHGRSLVPCQDLPGVKMTYTANATVPSWSTCVMSAVLKRQKAAADGDFTVFSWEQKVPIPSYLLAMAVGQLARKDISERCAVWSEPAIVEAAAYEFAQTEEFLITAESLSGAPYAWGRYDLLCLPPSCPYGGMENPCLTFVTPTLLAGDRSLADVVAHEIAHSWTGNLVTNASWDHFWLNEGWTTWLQRKIMARIHDNDKFLDFDAIGGWKDLEDTVKNDMPDEFTKLVLNIEDRDPDDMYSTVAYEKGFNFLMALERRVGKEPFERFFQLYVHHFSYKTVTSEEFKSFFLSHFDGNESIKDIPWDTWLYSPGMPPETPDFDKSMAQASEDLAIVWHAVDRNGRMLPTEDIKSWTSLQITTFLDVLQSLCNDEPLKVSTLNAMNKMYAFAQTKNSEILHRYCQLAVAAEDESILPVVIRFITSQGRMKFVRPLYRALHKSKMGRTQATLVFLENQDFYHPICTKMIALDLMIGKRRTAPWVRMLGYSVVAAAVLTGGAILFRRSKRLR